LFLSSPFFFLVKRSFPSSFPYPLIPLTSPFSNLFFNHTI
jgi:hypothetical protein